MRNAHKDIIDNLFHHTLGPMLGWNTSNNNILPHYYISKNSFGYTILADGFDSTKSTGTTINISGAPKSGRELIAWMDGIVFFIQHPQLNIPFREDVVRRLLKQDGIEYAKFPYIKQKDAEL